jgi:hypothetical protein
MRCSHKFDYHRLSEYESKKAAAIRRQSRAAVFWHLQAFDYFEVSPLRQDLSKDRCGVVPNTSSGFLTFGDI